MKFSRLLFWRHRLTVTGLSIPVIIPAGKQHISVDFADGKDRTQMWVRANGKTIGFKQTEKK